MIHPQSWRTWGFLKGLVKSPCPVLIGWGSLGSIPFNTISHLDWAGWEGEKHDARTSQRVAQSKFSKMSTLEYPRIHAFNGIHPQKAPSETPRTYRGWISSRRTLILLIQSTRTQMRGFSWLDSHWFSVQFLYNWQAPTLMGVGDLFLYPLTFMRVRICLFRYRDIEFDIRIRRVRRKPPSR